MHRCRKVENLRVEDGCLVFTVRKEPWTNPDFGKPSHYSFRRDTREADYSPRNFRFVVGGEQFHDCGPGEEPWNGFHTYTLDWYEDRLFMFYDGILYGKVDLSQADRPEGRNSFREPMFALMNIALGGGGPAKRNYVFDEDTVLDDGTTIPAATFPMEMKIDWVRHYRQGRREQ